MNINYKKILLVIFFGASLIFVAGFLNSALAVPSSCDPKPQYCKDNGGGTWVTWQDCPMCMMNNCYCCWPEGFVHPNGITSRGLSGEPPSQECCPDLLPVSDPNWRITKKYTDWVIDAGATRGYRQKGECCPSATMPDGVLVTINGASGCCPPGKGWYVGMKDKLGGTVGIITCVEPCCTSDADCNKKKPQEKVNYCSTQPCGDLMERTSYVCSNGQCVEDIKKVEVCTYEDGTCDKKGDTYKCGDNGYKVLKNSFNSGCQQESCRAPIGQTPDGFPICCGIINSANGTVTPASSCDTSVPAPGTAAADLCGPGQCFSPARCFEDEIWTEVDDCVKYNRSTEQLQCFGDNLKKLKIVGACSITPDGKPKPPYYTCGPYNKWVTIKYCGGCGVDGYVCQGSAIAMTSSCGTCSGNECKTNPGPSTIVMDCGPKQTISAPYCAGGVGCTLKVDYPGECFQIAGGVPSCKAPTVDIKCSGLCDNECSSAGSTQSCITMLGKSGTQTCGADGKWGLCSTCTPGATAPCATGGSQTCGVNGTWSACPETHKACVDYKCANAYGAGENKCTSDDQCADDDGLPCTPGAEIACENGGSQYCAGDGNSWTECPVTHMVCAGDCQCQSVVGAGSDGCQNNDDCCSIPPTKFVCDNSSPKQCVEVLGTGIGDCTNEDDCEKSSHKACTSDLKCMTIDGPGDDSCEGDSDCKHNVCTTNLPSQCVVATGPGEDDCAGSSDCPPPYVDTANICTDDSPRQCVEIYSQDKDDCIQDIECNSISNSHTRCNVSGNACLSMLGEGDDLCTDPNIDCQNDTHNACTVDHRCIEVAGAGINECTASPCFWDITFPYAADLETQEGDYCTGVLGSGLTYFQWVYKSLTGEKQKSFRMQISSDPEFADGTIVVDREYTNLSYSSDAVNQQSVYVRIETPDACQYDPVTREPFGCGGFISYNTPYYWRVRVTDVGFGSGWITSTTSYTKTGHPGPWANFIVQFPDSTGIVPPESELLISDFPSICYTETDPYVCSQSDDVDCHGGKCYTWWFGDPLSHNPVDLAAGDNNDKPNTKYTYNTTGIYTIYQKVCDEVGCCFATPQNISVKSNAAKELPKWKEISPF